MPYLIHAERVASDLQRCRTFLTSKKPRAAKRAGEAIVETLRTLRQYPDRGRVVEGALRELLIPFGDAGYVALYRFDPGGDVVTVLAIRHQKEAGY